MEETMKPEGGNIFAATPIGRLLLQFVIQPVLSMPMYAFYKDGKRW